jgi:PhnB protein
MAPTRTPKLAPYLLVKDASGLMRFMENALGGKISYAAKDSDGRLSHGEVLLCDSVVMLADSPPERPLFPAMLHLHVPDADEIYKRALSFGAMSVREPADAPVGDHRGGVRDAWGNEWWFTTFLGK